jgi:squalene-associated FAD-dependent desaturase
MNLHPEHFPTVGIVGGGLAGLAAGCALADSGFHVTLFERRPYLGGRASSYQHPGTGEVVDNCQHVLLGCCTNLIQFYERLGVEGKIRWYDGLTFLEPGGRSWVIAPSRLPAPLHTAPAFLRAAGLSLADKLTIAAAMAALAPATPRDNDNGDSFLTWLHQHGQTQRAIDRFWKTILVSALNEDLDRMSVANAAQVVRESFLKSAAAGRMGVPSVPLTELYSVAGEYIKARGGEVRLRSGVDCFRADPAGVTLSIAGEEASFEFAVFAVPFDILARLLPQTSAADPLREVLGRFGTSPITGIHLWFDRQITDLDHAVLLDRTIQWMFHKSKLLSREGRGFNRADRTLGQEAEGHGSDRADSPEQAAERRQNKAHGDSCGLKVRDDRAPEERKNSCDADSRDLEGNGSYVELVVSSSKTLVDKPKSEIIELALKELREFFPGARDANLLKSTVIKEVHATYSAQPGVDLYRPHAETLWPRVFLAGDWTATGWPATMEGAVRSGYMAAERIARISGQKDAAFLVSDLPAAGFMRMFR